MLKNLLDACGAAFAFFAVGYAIAYGGNDPTSAQKTFIGTSGFFLVDVSDEDLADWMFEYAFAATSTTIVAGALAERCQMSAYLCYSFVLVGWVYPVIVHSIWNPQGFLSPQSVEPLWGVGFIDFAGSGVVHLTGGVTALIAAKILGPRRGRFHDDNGRNLKNPNVFPGHSVALQMLGCFLLWVGWYGFNTGAALLLDSPVRGDLASVAAVNTALSAGVGGLSALFLNMIIQERLTGEPYFDLLFAMNGTLSGAVAITGSCALIDPWAAVVTGFFAGFFFIVAHHLVLYFRIDDCVDAIAGM
jgi:Amt family ammonium transporter